MDNEDVNIKLSKDESLVLFEFLSRFNEKESQDKVLFEDQAEQRVLWNLECILEKQLVEPFQQDYKQVIDQARDRVRDKE